MATAIGKITGAASSQQLHKAVHTAQEHLHGFVLIIDCSSSSCCGRSSHDENSTLNHLVQHATMALTILHHSHKVSSPSSASGTSGRDHGSAGGQQHHLVPNCGVIAMGRSGKATWLYSPRTILPHTGGTKTTPILEFRSIDAVVDVVHKNLMQFVAEEKALLCARHNEGDDDQVMSRSGNSFVQAALKAVTFLNAGSVGGGGNHLPRKAVFVVRSPEGSHQEGGSNSNKRSRNGVIKDAMEHWSGPLDVACSSFVTQCVQTKTEMIVMGGAGGDENSTMVSGSDPSHHMSLTERLHCIVMATGGTHIQGNCCDPISLAAAIDGEHHHHNNSRHHHPHQQHSVASSNRGMIKYFVTPYALSDEGGDDCGGAPIVAKDGVVAVDPVTYAIKNAC